MGVQTATSMNSVFNNNLTNLLTTGPAMTTIPPVNNFLIDGLLGTDSSYSPPSNIYFIAGFHMRRESLIIGYFLELPVITAYEKNGLRVDFSFDRPLDNPNLVITTLTATCLFGGTLGDFIFQAAVPKVNS